MTAVLTPIADGTAVDLGAGRLWRKQILKHGTIDYQGQQVTFDNALSQELAATFPAGNVDQVTFLLDDGTKGHKSGPEQFRGNVRKLIPTPTGLDAVLELSEEGDRVVRTNPRLGVSARIVTAIDGAKAYVEHVLGTLTPRLTGMGEWQPIELSGAPAEVLDLSSATYREEGLVPELTDDEVALFRAMLADKKAADDAAAAAKPPTPAVGVTPKPTEDSTPAGMSDDDIEKIVAGLLAASDNQPPAGTPAPVPVGAGAGADLSAETRAALELAQNQENARALQLAGIQSELDDTRYDRDADAYKQAGVPPKLVELARPLLHGTGHVIDLANGDQVDAGTVIRAVLDECKGTIDLGGEKGRNFVPAGQSTDMQGAIDMAAKFREQYGMGLPGLAARMTHGGAK